MESRSQAYSETKVHFRFPSLWIAFGGALGAIARHGLESTAFAKYSHGFPWTTFTINQIGTFILGLILTISEKDGAEGAWLRCFAGIGFCGAFTTFSTINLEFFEMARTGMLAKAVVYFAASFASGLVTAWAGARLGAKKRKECP